MKKILFFTVPIIAFSLLVGGILIFNQSGNKSLTAKDNLIIKGTSLEGDTLIIYLNNFEKAIVAFVNTQCDLCNDEIKDLLLIGKNSNIQVIILSTEKYDILKENISYTKPNAGTYILSMSPENAYKLKFHNFPHFLFYKNGRLINEHIGKINAEKYIEKIFR